MADVLPTLSAALADRYRLDRELGQGGMATVYLAHDHKLGRAVALKVLRPELAAALGGERFLREIEIAAKLAHPHILALHDCGEAAGLLYYTMPFVEGESLRDRLSRERQLPLDEALRIAREVADALSYAHALGLVHRDIKPENILFQAGHAVVSDFGIARAVSAAGGARLTETGLAVGTPAYMSPEQAAGSQAVDGRSDLYSLGCVLYEMLSGETPYTGPTPQAILAKKLSEPLPRISVVREAVGPGVEAVLAKALARTPADRWPTAAEFGSALAHGETPGAAWPAAPQALWWRPRRVAWAALAAAVVVAAALAVASGLRPDGPPRTAIAVLPLQNLSAEGPHAYFAFGLHDELLTQLAKVAALSVRPRTSVLRYSGTTKPMREIGVELAVGSIVEGTVQVVGNRLHVNVHLIDPVTEAQVWAEHFDRTLDDAFAVQTEIAQGIVQAVGARLSQAEQGAVGEPSTRNAEAYRLFLQGREYQSRPGYRRQNYEIAQRLFEQAIALDSAFALAHASLVGVHGAMIDFRFDTRPERVQRMRQDAEAARRLGPDLPLTHYALSAVHRIDGDYRASLREAVLYATALPGSANAWAGVGSAHYRVGEWSEALSGWRRAAELSPGDARFHLEVGNVLWLLHRYEEAVQAYDRALVLAPDMAVARLIRGLAYVLWQGRLDVLRAELDRGTEDYGPEGSGVHWRARMALWARDTDAVLALLPAPWRLTFVSQRFHEPALLYVAWAQRLRRDSVAARDAFRGALGQLDSALRTQPDAWQIHAARGLALAGLGRVSDARQEADWLSLSERSVGALYWAELGEARGLILAQAGLRDEALAELERQLGRPSNLSGPMLRVDPRWDPIRQDPRFQALLRRYRG